jgi:membrane associated rhomboid family serine protease
MLFIPYKTEVVITRWPITNILIIVACTLCYVLLAFGAIPEQVIRSMVLRGWNPIGLLGNTFLHGGIAHLFFNMLFLWVFGNAVCETMGNWRYLAAFIGAGLIADTIHNLCDGQPAIGASGAINGIIGFYLVLYPINIVDCFYWIFFRAGSVEVTGYWLVILWFLGDAWGAFIGSNTGPAYWAHLGGLAAGIGLGILFETRGWAKLAEYDNPSLVDLLFRKKRENSITHQSEVVEKIKQQEQVRVMSQSHQPKPKIRLPKYFQCECPHCHAAVQLNEITIGHVTQCPHCAGEFNVEE